MAPSKGAKKEIQHSLTIIFANLQINGNLQMTEEGFGILGTNELANTTPCGNRLQASRKELQ